MELLLRAMSEKTHFSKNGPVKTCGIHKILKTLLITK